MALNWAAHLVAGGQAWPSTTAINALSAFCTALDTAAITSKMIAINCFIPDTLATLDQPRSLEILNAVFHAPDKLRPGVTSQAITERASGHFADIAESMRERGLEPQAVAQSSAQTNYFLVYLPASHPLSWLPSSRINAVTMKPNPMIL
jgi:hypothetical protein